MDSPSPSPPHLTSVVDVVVVLRAPRKLHTSPRSYNAEHENSRGGRAIFRGGGRKGFFAPARFFSRACSVCVFRAGFSLSGLRFKRVDWVRAACGSEVKLEVWCLLLEGFLSDGV